MSEPATVDSPAGGSPAGSEAGAHVARAGRYFRNVRYVIFVAAIGLGAYFLYDGFVSWPHQRAEYQRLEAAIVEAQNRGASIDALRAEQAQYKEHSETDILLQKILGFTVIPLSILLLIRWLYISRGEVRMDAMDTLHAPGHPPVPASAVTGIDDRLWDRKGIAYVDYQRSGGESGRLKLDDFVYERQPIDAIHDRLSYLLSRRD